MFGFKRKTKLLIHAGTPKTGTTTFQQSMFAHRDRLLKEGILYPDLDIAPGMMKKHQWLVQHLLEEDRASFRSKFDELSDMSVKSRATLVVLSTEGIFNHWSNYSAIARGMLSDLANLFDVSVWCVFREPLAFALSRYGQVVKNPPTKYTPENGTSLSMEDIIQYPSFRKRLDYANFIYGIESLFGKESIVVTQYESADILVQARSILGVSDTTLPDVPRMNESLSPLGVDLVRRMNSVQLPEAREELLAKIAYIDKLLGSTSYPQTVSAEFRRQIKALSAPSEKLLAERFGIRWTSNSTGD
ncbi:hypothetical protein [Cohnella yongneupensis]|uniref:Sulfotransferase family protein n=1 Tax=Cohnella yongneupensis TaxID=425006 RepID=A0ABW0QY86_9BACL